MGMLWSRGSCIPAQSFAVVQGWLWGAQEALSDSKCSWLMWVGCSFACKAGGFSQVACTAFRSHPALHSSIPLAKGSHCHLMSA